MFRFRFATLAVLLACATPAAWAQKADLVLVKKSESRLYLKQAGRVLASYKVSFGKRPKGHKQREGDKRTPEGRYLLDFKNENSKFYRSIHISYPNANDVAAAKARGVSPGGMIMIHGQKNGYEWLQPASQIINWTDGCIALKNRDMDKVWAAVDEGTPIQIDP